MSFVDWSLQRGGRLYPIFFSPNMIQGQNFMNPSIFVFSSNNALLVFRSSDYRYLRPTNHLRSLTSTGGIQYLFFKKNGKSDPFFLVTVNFETLSNSRVVPIKVTRQLETELHINRNFRASTIEDLRITKVDDSIVMLGNIEVGSGKRRPIFLTTGLPKQNQEIIRINCEYLIDYGGLRQVEKNWVPIESKVDKFVRFPYPVQLSSSVKLINNETYQYEMFQSRCEEMSGMLGSTPLSKLRDGYLALVHSKTLGSSRNNHRYWHRCIYYDKNFRVEKVSKPFTFLGFDTEFCTGLSIYEDKVYLSFCCNDGVNFILVIDSVTLFRDYMKEMPTK